MDASHTAEPGFGAQRTARFHRWRRYKDRLARWGIAIGGVTVIWAVVLILFYLVWVVFPLFLPASVEQETVGFEYPNSGVEPVYLAIEEQQQVALSLGADGSVAFFSLDDGRPVASDRELPRLDNVVSVASVVNAADAMAVLSDDGTVALLQQEFVTNFDGGVAGRRIVPRLLVPYADGSITLLESGAGVRDLAASDGDAALVLAALGSDGRVYVSWNDKNSNFLTGDVQLAPRQLGFTAPAGTAQVAISGDQRFLYLGDDRGQVHQYRLPGLDPVTVVAATDVAITELEMLLGGISVLAGDAGGGITQLFPVRGEENRYPLKRVRGFTPLSEPVERLVMEQRRKGFAALGRQGELAIYHSTADRRMWSGRIEHAGAIAISPRANGLLAATPGGGLTRLHIENEHPEISFASMWQKVWYENYQEPEYVWQSSSASNEFEPKFSLTPLAFGTLKAALYAMLFAVPLALTGAAFTAYFMSPALRGLVKPTIEIMAALPTVILGFLAGLWFAPWLEEHLAGVFAIMLCVPLAAIAFGWLWQHPLARMRQAIPAGWEPVLLVPVVIGATFFALWVAGPIENLLFQGDLRTFLSQEMGISYDQRNALVVGAAMGFAVIPTIFSLSEDAVFGVPRSLSDGSLALGATPWQTLVRVILPTASPGIFSALMIGLGRAVGETMIVLMATGNTPIMDWNLFEGMRTLSANIAVEMPESEVGGSHYRILFLAALVLFMFTFVVNTVAEVVRQRLRDKYSAI